MPSRHFVRLCERSDFDDELLAMVRSISPGRQPAKEIHRKLWEYAMLGMYLEQMDALGESARVLSVAAGHEPVLFWLANRAGKVVATDIYGDGSFGEREAQASMLRDPRALAPYPYPEDHLEVHHMNALALDFDVESFDVVFCLSSIEHFGGPAATRRAVGEMARVLRTGGHLVITTECLLGRHPLDSRKLDFAIRLATLGRRCAQATLTGRAIDAYTPDEIERDIVVPLAASGITLTQPLNLAIAPENFDNVILMSDAEEPTSAAGAAYPHIVLRYFGSPWTSIFLALRKGHRSG